jgi:hypothetical protein
MKEEATSKRKEKGKGIGKGGRDKTILRLQQRRLSSVNSLMRRGFSHKEER